MAEITQQQWDELQAKYEQLRLNEEMYRVAIGLTDHTITVVDIPNRTLNQIYNEGDWTGVASSMPNAPESIIATGIIHPDDCDGYRAFYQEIYAGVPRGSYTMRVMEEKRGWVWFTMTYQTVFSPGGEPLRAICFSDDITVQKKAEEKYQQYRTAVIADAEFVWEANLTTDTVLSVASNLESAFEMEKISTYSDLSEQAISNVTDPVQKSMMREVFGREQLLRAFYSAKREVSAEHLFDYQDGKPPRWLHSTAYLMTNNVEDVTVIICSNDITDRHRELEYLEMRAERDTLTGLYNRASFEHRAEKTLAEELDGIHGLLMIDCDDFKHCNDSFGHAYGDSVLELIAKIMQQTFRTTDYLGRVGGDEFMVLMRNAGGREIILKRAEDLQRNLEDVCRARNLPTKITLSIGLAASRPGDTFQSLYLRADKAMYRGKKQGKNCIRSAD